jgi:hypothetical protein
MCVWGRGGVGGGGQSTRMRSAATSGATFKREQMRRGRELLRTAAHISGQRNVAAVAAGPEQFRSEVGEDACGGREDAGGGGRMSWKTYFEQPPSSRKNAARAAISNKVERHNRIKTKNKNRQQFTNVRFHLRNNLLIRHRHGDAVSVCFMTCNCVRRGKDDGVTERLVGCTGSRQRFAHRCGEGAQQRASDPRLLCARQTKTGGRALFWRA